MIHFYYLSRQKVIYILVSLQKQIWDPMDFLHSNVFEADLKQCHKTIRWIFFNQIHVDNWKKFKKVFFKIGQIIRAIFARFINVIRMLIMFFRENFLAKKIRFYLYMGKTWFSFIKGPVSYVICIWDKYIKFDCPLLKYFLFTSGKALLLFVNLAVPDCLFSW